MAESQAPSVLKRREDQVAESVRFKIGRILEKNNISVGIGVAIVVATTLSALAYWHNPVELSGSLRTFFQMGEFTFSGAVGAIDGFVVGWAGSAIGG